MDFCTIASQLNVASAKGTPINCRDGCADPLSGSIMLRSYSAQSQLSIVDGEIECVSREILRQGETALAGLARRTDIAPRCLDFMIRVNIEALGGPTVTTSGRRLSVVVS